jgi:hypothetical protein
MVEGLHIQNRTMKPLATALSGAEGAEGERWWGQSIQCTV